MPKFTFRGIAVLLICLPLFSLCGFCDVPSTAQLKKILQEKYLHKTFTFRGFYVDNYFQFDSNGLPLGDVHPGSWTCAMLEIEKIKISRYEVQLEGPHIAEQYDSKQLKFIPVVTNVDTVLTIERDASQPYRVVDLLEHIFLQQNDHLNDLVPDYWKPFLQGKVEVVPQETGPDCYRIKGDLVRTEDGKTSLPCNEHAKLKAVVPLDTNLDIFTNTFGSSKNVMPPERVSTPNPIGAGYCRSQGFRAEELLRVTVNTDGTTSDIAILQPAGCGDDDESAAILRTWKFKPAMFRGQPVSMSINVRFTIEISN